MSTEKKATIYPVRIDPDGDQFSVSFRDIPEALTFADTREQALVMAKDALITAMDFYFEDGREVPGASEALPGEELIELPANVALKVLLLNEIVSQNVRPTDLATMLGESKQTITRILDIKHATKVNSIQKAFKALGRDLSFSLE